MDGVWAWLDNQRGDILRDFFHYLRCYSLSVVAPLSRQALLLLAPPKVAMALQVTLQPTEHFARLRPQSLDNASG